MKDSKHEWISKVELKLESFSLESTKMLATISTKLDMYLGKQEEEELPMKAFHGIRDAEGICHLYLSDGETLRKSAPTVAVPFMTIAQRFLSGDMADRDLASYRSLSLSKH